MATRSTVAERAEWLENLRETLPPGSTVYTVLRNVSASGMTRSIDAYALTADPDDPGRIVKSWLSYRIAAVLGYPYDERRECVKVGGAGMDMGFHLVYSLSSKLYPDGFDCTGEHCPSNAHTNGQARPHRFPLDRGYERGADSEPCNVYDRGKPGDICGLTADQHRPFSPAPHHTSGGYALRQEWL